MRVAEISANDLNLGYSKQQALNSSTAKLSKYVEILMNHKIQDSSFSIVARLRDEKSWLLSRQYRGIIFVSETSRPVLGLTNLLDNGYRSLFPWGTSTGGGQR